MTVPQLLTAATLLPLVGAVAGLTARWWRAGRYDLVPGLVAAACVAGSFGLSVAAAVRFEGPEPLTGTFYRVLDLDAVTLELGYHVDGLTLTMFELVTLVALCITVFALGYLADELTHEYRDHAGGPGDDEIVRPGRLHLFMAYLCLFCTAMLTLLLAGNLFMVFVGWELVGACSYLLIGFYYERPTAGAAATKAFVTNRIGDCGFLIGLAALLAATGDVRFAPLFAAREAGAIPETALLVGTLGLFAGCVGKSAQFPLQVWLPDAMAGPTPVSALVHSATMVAAGVYLVGRTLPLFPAEALLAVAYVGCVTLVVGAVAALFQTDLKAVLAYSTVSQLGYMMLALGVTGWGAGLFHLVTHAFFKSLMFLAAGSVIVACHHVQDVTKLGGLMRRMPVTAGAMLVGVIAISGLAIPGVTLFGDAISLSGYHSKDAILTHALAFTEANPGHAALFWAPLLTAGLTALYMVRLWALTFTGPLGEAGRDAKENPAVMLAPLCVLAGLAAFCAVGGDDGPLYGFLADAKPAGLEALTSRGDTFVTPTEPAVEEAHHTAAVLGLTAAGVGTLAGVLLYGFRLPFPGLGTAERLRRTRPGRFFASGWGFDTLYRATVLRPIRWLGEMAAAVDTAALDGIVHGAAALTAGVARVERTLDERLVDGLVLGVGRTARAGGFVFRRVQGGGVRQYVAVLAAGAVGLAVAAVLLLAG